MLHFNILHYQFLWIFHDKIQSNMHNFTLFSREIEWNLKCFHFFREMKSETNIPFTLFEKWKVKWFFVSLFSRSESEIEIPRDRDREVKFQKKSREFSRNETLAGYCYKRHIFTFCFCSLRSFHMERILVVRWRSSRSCCLSSASSRGHSMALNRRAPRKR